MKKDWDPQRLDVRSFARVGATISGETELMFTGVASALGHIRNGRLKALSINGPRRSAAKTYVTKALKTVSGTAEGDPQVALVEAIRALDLAAKVGAIHPNAAARRKSRLAKKVNAAVGGAHVQTSSHVTKTTGKAAAAKAAGT